MTQSTFYYIKFVLLTNLFHSDIITKEGAYEIVGEIEK